MLQPTPDGKAIWRATVTSSTGWTHSFTLLRLAPALIWEPGERPPPFAGAVVIDAALADKNADPAVPTPAIVAMPAAENQQSPLREDAGGADDTARPLITQASPDVMEDMLAMVGMERSPVTTQDVQTISNKVSGAHADASPLLAPPAPISPPAVASPPSASSPSGEHFMAWLRQGISSRRLIINDAKALVHTVSDTAYLVSPGVFQRYAQEHPQVGMLAKQENQQDWQWVQKRFERLQLHRKQPNGLNIWTCEVTGPRKSRRLHGYLLLESRSIFSDAPPNNPFLKLA